MILIKDYLLSRDMSILQHVNFATCQFYNICICKYCRVINVHVYDHVNTPAHEQTHALVIFLQIVSTLQRAGADIYIYMNMSAHVYM